MKMFTMMLVFIASVFLAAARGYSDIDDYENFIDYGQSNNQFRHVALPFAYKRSREERVAKPLATFVEEEDNGRLILPVPIVPEVAVELGVSKLELIGKAVKTTFALGKKAIVFILSSAPAIIIGTFLAFGFCKFTPFCSKLSGLTSLVEVQREIRSYATPERLASASEFVQSAIRKYRSLQESED